MNPDYLVMSETKKCPQKGWGIDVSEGHMSEPENVTNGRIWDNS